MIKNSDTLPYKDEMEVRDGKAVYLGTCWTFEKINGQIINQQDRNCLSQGRWKISDDSGNYRIGDYIDGKSVGVWKHFDKAGKLLKETETVSIGRDTYTIKEIDYSTGQAVTIVNKPFLAFYLKNLFVIVIILFVSFFSRIFINSRIYNIENGTKNSPIYLQLGPLVTNNFGHSVLCTFSFWFSNYKPENKRLVLITNTLSIISLGIFFGIIVGLAITGEI
ncbi:MAG: hypothetical protein ABIQ40_11910 [Bacteroidia bacterium]